MRRKGESRTSPPTGDLAQIRICASAYGAGMSECTWLLSDRLVFELTWRDFFIYMAWSQGILHLHTWMKLC